MASTGIGIDLSLPLAAGTREALAARLEARTRKTATCWLWIGSTTRGYGTISVHNRPAYVHRVAYAVHRGPIPAGAYVLHDCDVPHCWHPDHLFLGSHEENMADMLRKGGGSPPPTHYGEAHPQATLTDEQVAAIRSRWARGGVRQRELAAAFHVAQSTIWRLIHGVVRP